jgi:hypothetical protein
MYLLTVAALSRHEHVPPWLMRFLDDAHRLGVLRRVGPVYQFRHARMQDHFARRHRRERGIQ